MFKNQDINSKDFVRLGILSCERRKSLDSKVKFMESEEYEDQTSNERQSPRKSQTNEHLSICPDSPFVFLDIVRLSILCRSISGPFSINRQATDPVFSWQTP